MPERNLVWQSVARYFASALIAIVVISALGVFAFRRIGENEAIHDAKDQTRASAFWAIDPKLIDRVLESDRKALADLDRLVRTRILRDSSVVRVKIWNRAGEIVYSDEPRLIGARYPIPPDEQDEFMSSNIEAEVSDLSKPENRFERNFGKLLEVYAALTTPSGKHVRYEEYYRSSFIAARGNRIFHQLGYIGLVALILLALIQLPLAWQLAHRVQRAQRERMELLQRAVDASDRERRRIAADLHDGVVQDLAGVSYSLAAASSIAPPDLAPALEEAAVGHAAGDPGAAEPARRDLSARAPPPGPRARAPRPAHPVYETRAGDEPRDGRSGRARARGRGALLPRHAGGASKRDEACGGEARGRRGRARRMDTPR